MDQMSLEIDRIVLTDLGMTPDIAKRMRSLVEMELQQILEQGGWPDGLADGTVRRLESPTIHLAEPHSDSRLANELAQSIAQAVRGLKVE